MFLHTFNGILSVLCVVEQRRPTLKPRLQFLLSPTEILAPGYFSFDPSPFFDTWLELYEGCIGSLSNFVW
jgi:hypothetical protein